MKKKENFAPFDYAQGDCQTERSRSLLSLTKRHWFLIDNDMFSNSDDLTDF